MKFYDVCDLRHTLQFLPGPSITSSQIDWLERAYGGLHVTNTIKSFSGSGAIGTSRSPQQSVRAGGPSAPPENAPSADADQVRITDAASQLANLGQKLTELPDIDSARVARISAALAAGTYTISANSIANGLLQSEQTLAQIGM